MYIRIICSTPVQEQDLLGICVYYYSTYYVRPLKLRRREHSDELVQWSRYLTLRLILPERLTPRYRTLTETSFLNIVSSTPQQHVVLTTSKTYWASSISMFSTPANLRARINISILSNSPLNAVLRITLFPPPLSHTLPLYFHYLSDCLCAVFKFPCSNQPPPLLYHRFIRLEFVVENHWHRITDCFTYSTTCS